MHSGFTGTAIIAAAVLALAACDSSSPSVGPIQGFAESDLAGRFALTEPFIDPNYGRIVADTIVLGADRSATRYFTTENEQGVATPSWHGGGYEIIGNTIRVSYTSTSSGGYGLFGVVTMEVLGTSSRVTRLEVEHSAGTLTYDRVRSR